MEIEYRIVNPTSFEEMRMFLITHEYSWRDSDPEGFVPKSEEKRDKSALKFMEDLKDPEEKYYALAAFCNNQMIGSLFLDRYKIDGKDACHIHGLWIDSNFRGKGIAYKLKEMGEDWARSKKCVFMDSNVRVTNEAMITLNKKMGYSVIRYNFRKDL
jgi:ribosomal protein S18 acetylase RimI-like enzyme